MALADSLRTLVMGFATLSDAHWSMSAEVIGMSLLGEVGVVGELQAFVGRRFKRI
jgi:hypothetical protein